jgi:hypothetical protein
MKITVVLNSISMARGHGIALAPWKGIVDPEIRTIV